MIRQNPDQSLGYGIKRKHQKVQGLFFVPGLASGLHSLPESFRLWTSSSEGPTNLPKLTNDCKETTNDWLLIQKGAIHSLLYKLNFFSSWSKLVLKKSAFCLIIALKLWVWLLFSSRAGGICTNLIIAHFFSTSTSTSTSTSCIQICNLDCAIPSFPAS